MFTKYTRAWLHQVTGYSKAYLSRMATGKIPLNRPFVSRICSMLNQPEEDLFLPDGSSGPDIERGGIGEWLRERCKREHLSLRQAADKTGLSHSTIGDIIRGSRPLPETIRKLAYSFGGDGKLALEDHLLELASYRRLKPEGEEPDELQAYQKIIPLLSPEHQHIVKVLLTELAKIEGIKIGGEA